MKCKGPRLGAGLYIWIWRPKDCAVVAGLLRDYRGLPDGRNSFLLSDEDLGDLPNRERTETARGQRATENWQTRNAGIRSAKSPIAQEAVGAWYEEVRDLSLILSRKIARSVNLKLPRAHAKSHEDRLKSDLEALIENHCLTVVLDIPDAASVITVTADVRAKSISASMRLRAPEDKQSTKARLNWLLRQIQAVEDVADVHVRLFWPGRGSYSQHSVVELRANPEKAGADKNGVVPHTFEVCMVRQLGGRFGQRKNFIVDLETIVPAFYENVGQRLKMWQASAPRVREERSDSAGGIEHVREAAEEESRTEAAE